MQTDLLSYLKESLDELKMRFQSDEILCAGYAYSYEKTREEKFKKRFIELWNKICDKERKIVIRYYYSFNNYEMLRKINLVEEHSNVQKMMISFIKNGYFDEKDSLKSKIKNKFKK